MNLNMWAVLVAGLAHFVIGIIWYSPFMFGKIWMKLSGVKEMKPDVVDLLGSILASLLISAVMASLVFFTRANTVFEGISLGIIIEIGFVATLLLGDVIFEKKPLSLFILRNGYNLVAFMTVGAILAVWH